MHTSLLGDAATTLVEHVSLLAVWFVIALISSWVAWAKGFFHLLKPLDWPPLQFSEMFAAFSVFLLSMLFLAPILIIIGASLWHGHVVELKNISSDVTLSGWIDVVTIVITGLMLIAYFFLLPMRARRAILGPSSFLGIQHNLRNMILGGAIWAVSYPIVVIIGQIVAIAVQLLHLELPKHEQVAVQSLRGTLEHPILFVSMALLLIFVVPTIEEMLFRGCLQTWIKNRLGRVWGIVLASSIFALFHFSTSQGFDNVELLLSLFVLGCFLGYLYERQQSLWASVGLHATFNAISVLVITEVA